MIRRPATPLRAHSHQHAVLRCRCERLRRGVGPVERIVRTVRRGAAGATQVSGREGHPEAAGQVLSASPYESRPCPSRPQARPVPARPGGHGVAAACATASVACLGRGDRHATNAWPALVEGRRPSGAGSRAAAARRVCTERGGLCAGRERVRGCVTSAPRCRPIRNGPPAWMRVPDSGPGRPGGRPRDSLSPWSRTSPPARWTFRCPAPGAPRNGWRPCAPSPNGTCVRRDSSKAMSMPWRSSRSSGAPHPAPPNDGGGMDGGTARRRCHRHPHR